MYHCIICGSKYIRNQSCPGLFGTPCNSNACSRCSKGKWTWDQVMLMVPGLVACNALLFECSTMMRDEDIKMKNTPVITQIQNQVRGGNNDLIKSIWCKLPMSNSCDLIVFFIFSLNKICQLTRFQCLQNITIQLWLYYVSRLTGSF